MKKAAAIILVLAVAMSGVFLLVNYKSRSAKRRSALTAARSEISTLMHEKNELQSELEDYESKSEAMQKESMTVTLFFDTLSDSLADNVYPLLNKYSLKGTIVMRDGLFPSDTDCISRSNFDAMLDAGWDIAIGEPANFDPTSDTAANDLAYYLDSYADSMKRRAIDVPTVFCFDEGDYDKKFDSVLTERGFTMVRRGTECNTLAETEDGLLKLMGAVICADKSIAQKYVMAAQSMSTSVAVVTGNVTDDPEDTSIDCTVEKYTMMLDYLKESCPEASILTASELYEYKTAPKTKSAYEDKIEETENKIAQVEEKIQQVYDTLK